MKWLILGLVFIFGLVGIQTYRNVELTRYGYQEKKLEKDKEELKKSNEDLRRKISTSYSLGRLEGYAREQLSLTDPKKVRFLKKKSFPEGEVSSKMQRFSFVSTIFRKMFKGLKKLCFSNKFLRVKGE